MRGVKISIPPKEFRNVLLDDQSTLILDGTDLASQGASIYRGGLMLNNCTKLISNELADFVPQSLYEHM